MLVAIDGPAGAGKSTVARAVSGELGFRFLDSGAMYRCVALLSLEQPAREAAELARAAKIELVAAPAADAPGGGRDARPGERIVLDGRDVSEQIRVPEVSEAASLIAADPAVREALVAKQRALLGDGDWVAEGRDIGTVVAPDAALKVFLSATPEERARRRARELGADEATVLAEQTLRDERDASRRHSPLRPAAGAITIDTTGIELDTVVARIVGLAQAAMV